MVVVKIAVFTDVISLVPAVVKAIAKVLALVIALLVVLADVRTVVYTVAEGITKQLLIINQKKHNDSIKRRYSTLAVRHGEEHHLHRHQGLPVGLQILLPRGQERERANALGSGQDLHRLCA